MDTNLSVSGFGYAKALIFGEYAVMYGARGVAVALDAKFELHLNHAHLSGEHSPDPKNLFDAKDVLANWLRPSLVAQIDADDRLFFDDLNNKYGIGSSAASVVAAVQAHARACAALSHCAPPDKLLIQAIEAHRALQNGLGSGIDIAASALGGVVGAKNCDTAIEVSRLAPHHLPPMGIFTMHRRAATLPFIRAAERVRCDRKPKKILAQMADLYEEMYADIEQASKRRFIETIPRLLALLRSWGECIDMPVIPSDFDIVERLARESGAVVKTAGAGGGDLIIAFAETPANIDDFAQKLALHAISRLPFAIAPERDYP